MWCSWTGAARLISGRGSRRPSRPGCGRGMQGPRMCPPHSGCGRAPPGPGGTAKTGPAATPYPCGAAQTTGSVELDLPRQPVAPDRMRSGLEGAAARSVTPGCLPPDGRSAVHRPRPRLRDRTGTSAGGTARRGPGAGSRAAGVPPNPEANGAAKRRCRRPPVARQLRHPSGRPRMTAREVDIHTLPGMLFARRLPHQRCRRTIPARHGLRPQSMALRGFRPWRQTHRLRVFPYRLRKDERHRPSSLARRCPCQNAGLDGLPTARTAAVELARRIPKPESRLTTAYAGGLRRPSSCARSRRLRSASCRARRAARKGRPSRSDGSGRALLHKSGEGFIL